MQRILIAAVLAALALAAPAHAEIGRDDQWSYIAAGPDGGPTAELRADGARPADHLLFRISCDPKAHVLVFEYVVGEDFDQLLPEYRAAPLELILDDRSNSMPTHRSGDRLIGRLALRPDLVRKLEAAREIFLYGPSDMDEAWYAGNARPLRRVARECL